MTDATPTELRQDPITGNWVIVAAGRGARPHEFARQSHTPPDEGECPFCPGNESETPPEVWRLDGPDGKWRVRVVPNLYAVLEGDGPAIPRTSPEGFRSLPGYGSHEVIIETPEHGGDLATFEIQQVRDVLEAYRSRYRALAQEGAALVVIFRNHGARAGTSLVHPHSQVVAAPLIPNDVQHRLHHAIDHYEQTGRSLYVDVLDRELQDGRRILLTTDRLVAFMPFASAWPYETWIMPRVPCPSFGATSDGDLNDLASVLRSVLSGLRRDMDDPDYNYVIHSTPASYLGRDFLTWYLRLTPRLTTLAGFELGTGICVNLAPPEMVAGDLRQVIADSA